MKRILLGILGVWVWMNVTPTQASNMVLNGNLENFTNGFGFTGCYLQSQTSLSLNLLTGIMPNIEEFGTANDIDIYKGAELGLCLQNPPTVQTAGKYMFGLLSNAQGAGTFDAFSLELSNGGILNGGTTYHVTFFDLGPNWTTPANIKIGYSTSEDTFGTQIYPSSTGSPTIANTWTQRAFDFTPPTTDHYYLTVMADPVAPPNSYVYVDGFTMDVAAGVVEFDPNVPVHLFPNPTSAAAQIIGLGDTPKKVIVNNALGKSISITLESNDAILDLSEYTSGVYLIQVIDESSHRSRTLQLIKK
jgi:hypothetical protein